MLNRALFRKRPMTRWMRQNCTPRLSDESEWRFEDFMQDIGPTDENGCWPWLGTCQEHRRATFCYDGEKWLAAHLSLMFSGRWRPSPKHCALHACDNPNCVNPDHLSWGTQAENMADMKAKGRSAKRKGERSPTAKLTDDQIREIRLSSEPQRALGKRFGVDPSRISLIRNRKAWPHVED